MEGVVIAHDQKGLNLKATELRLGLPGRDESESEEEMVSPVSAKMSNKRASPESVITETATKSQIVGWPPVRSYRKNNLVPEKKMAEVNSTESGIYVKVSMDGAPYLRKIDLKVYNGYAELLKALETMFKLTIGEYNEREGYKGSEYAPAYEDKDGDLMLVGDVPWEMFKSSCKRLRIMKGSEARGLGCGV